MQKVNDKSIVHDRNKYKSFYRKENEMSHKSLQKNCWLVWSWLLLASLLSACGASVPGPSIPTPDPNMQSFLPPVSWSEDPTLTQGWERPRMLAYMNLLSSDGKDHGADLVSFGSNGVYVATSTGSSFDPPVLVIPDFGYNQGWRVEKHVRLIGDINGDGLKDVVGFGDAGVFRALSTGPGFGSVTFVLAHFSYKQGWYVDRDVRLLSDMNGDGKDDIVGFANSGVWVSLATSDGYFTENYYRASPHFGEDEGWRVDKHIRLVADMNNDGKKDIIAFGDDGVWLSLATSDGKFAEPSVVVHAFGYNQGWRAEKHDRVLGDLNFDGKPEIIGFNDDGGWISWSTETGWTEPRKILDYWFSGSKPHTRYVADFNGDGPADILWIGEYGASVALGSSGNPMQFKGLEAMLRVHAFTFDDSISRDDLTGHNNLVGDVNGDGKPDLVIFSSGKIKVALSSDQHPPSNPMPPSELHITSKGSNSIQLAWTDNSNDEVGFLIHWKQDKPDQFARPNQTSFTVTGLDSDTDYCLTVEAESTYGYSMPTQKVCDHTNPIQQPPTPPPADKGPFTTTIHMQKQDIGQGYVPYLGQFGPIYDTGAIISNINFPTQYAAVLLVKPGNSTNDCGDPDAVIQVWGDMTADQKIAIWGSATPSIYGYQTLPFVGCTTDPQIPVSLPVNITWSRP